MGRERSIKLVVLVGGYVLGARRWIRGVVSVSEAVIVCSQIERRSSRGRLGNNVNT